MKELFIVPYYLFFFVIFTLGSCQVLPDGYVEALTSGTWRSIETINTPAGIQNIVRTQTFNPNGHYTLTEEHPISGSSVSEFLYTVGYYEPKYAYVFHEINNPQAVVGLPTFFQLRDDLRTLITSTNSSMALSRSWTK